MRQDRKVNRGIWKCFRDIEIKCLRKKIGVRLIIIAEGGRNQKALTKK